MNNKITFIELFSGIGGFRYGLERNKMFKNVWANDNNKYANQVYKKNYGEKELQEGDIRTIDTDWIPNHDLLCAGFPCQAFSLAGKRQGFNDTRGTLFFEIARILEAKRPKIVLLENVKGLLSHDNGKTFGRIIQVLGDLGYWVEWQVLNSKNFGVPQNRERVFIVGHLRNKSSKQIFPLGKSYPNNCKEFSGEKKVKDLLKSDREIYRLYDAEGLSPTLHGKTGGWQEPKIAYALDANYGKGNNNLSKCRRTVVGCAIAVDYRNKRVMDESPALLGNDHNTIHRIIRNQKIRRLTPIECERLQGFPDNWTGGLSDTQRYKCLGNAVTTNVIQAIGEKLCLK